MTLTNPRGEMLAGLISAEQERKLLDLQRLIGGASRSAAQRLLLDIAFAAIESDPSVITPERLMRAAGIDLRLPEPVAP